MIFIVVLTDNDSNKLPILRRRFFRCQSVGGRHNAPHLLEGIEDQSIAEHAVIRSDLDWAIVRASSDRTLKYTVDPSARIAPLRELPFANCADSLVRWDE